MSLDDIALLDRVQKGLPVSTKAIAHLRRTGLVEGHKPHLHISASIAAATVKQAAYMRKRELSGRRYRQLIIDYLEQFPGMSRKKINELMMDEIRGELNDDEKIAKITNLLTYLRRKGFIENRGTSRRSAWFKH